MEQPLGFVGGGAMESCHMRKSLYGLKQSPRAWFEKFSDIVQEFSRKRASVITQSSIDISVWYYSSS